MIPTCFIVLYVLEGEKSCKACYLMQVGALIGKAGDTIRSLQYNSGARIQSTRDAEAVPNSDTRPVELIGSLESITKAEKLIKDAIAEVQYSQCLCCRGLPSTVS